MFNAQVRSFIGVSLISRDEELRAVEMEEQNSITAGEGRVTEREKLIRLYRPLICGSKLESGRLKFTGQAV